MLMKIRPTFLALAPSTFIIRVRTGTQARTYNPDIKSRFTHTSPSEPQSYSCVGLGVSP